MYLLVNCGPYYMTMKLIEDNGVPFFFTDGCPGAPNDIANDIIDLVIEYKPDKVVFCDTKLNQDVKKHFIMFFEKNLVGYFGDDSNDDFYVDVKDVKDNDVTLIYYHKSPKFYITASRLSPGSFCKFVNGI